MSNSFQFGHSPQLSLSVLSPFVARVDPIIGSAVCPQWNRHAVTGDSVSSNIGAYAVGALSFRMRRHRRRGQDLSDIQAGP